VGTARPRCAFRGLMQSISGDVGSASRHFDSSSPAYFCCSIGMTADSSMAAAFYLEALSKAKGTNGKR
jgi:hypothetical protein